MKTLIQSILLLIVLISATVLFGCAAEESVTSPNPVAGRVIDVKIIDTEDYKGPMPKNLTGRAGELIELRLSNEDHLLRSGEIIDSFHPIVLRGPGVNRGILSLRPGDIKSITFTAQAGIYTFSCTNTVCDIHQHVTGTIEIVN